MEEVVVRLDAKDADVVWIDIDVEILDADVVLAQATTKLWTRLDLPELPGVVMAFPLASVMAN